MTDDDAALAELLATTISSTGASLANLSDRSPLLVVFLRHSGCTFCRQALADLAAQRTAIQSHGAKIVVVHMDDPAKMSALAAKYGLSDLTLVSDPEQKLYAAFALRRGSLWQILGPVVIWRGLKAVFGERHGWGVPASDVRQLPGAFLVHHRRIVRAYRHQTAADRPDYRELSRSVSDGSGPSGAA